MSWNWQHPEWPDFKFEPDAVRESEAQFLQRSGVMIGAFAHLDEDDAARIRVEFLSEEAMETSRIEGEYLNRESLQSSVRRHFGISTDSRRVSPAESGVAEVMVDVFRHFSQDLTDRRLTGWHGLLMKGRRDLREVGTYRSLPDPMQIVSGPVHRPKVHFEAPASEKVSGEMERFLRWFNGSCGETPALTRAAIAHLYFESIHPFEDGNGRIGRAIAEWSLSQSLGKPLMLSLSQSIGKAKKEYYLQLQSASKGLEITGWIQYFSGVVLDAQEFARQQIFFLVGKAKFFGKYRSVLNPRQEKVLLRLFEAGPDGFEGGLSASNYASISKTSPATVTRDLAELVEIGALSRSGERRHARYLLNLPNQD